MPIQAVVTMYNNLSLVTEKTSHQDGMHLYIKLYIKIRLIKILLHMLNCTVYYRVLLKGFKSVDGDWVQSFLKLKYTKSRPQ